MRKIYQTEWLGIDFKSFAKVDACCMAGEVFYNQFYDAFFRKYLSYADLPNEWKAEKKMVADFIVQQTKNGDHLLSLGCGSGFVEYLISRQSRQVTAIEPSESATKFLRGIPEIKLYQGYFPECLKDVKSFQFDLAYMSAVEYGLDNVSLAKLLADMKMFGVKSFFLISVCVQIPSFLRTLKDLVKSSLWSLGVMKRGQFWGYARTVAEFKSLFKNAGFENIESGFLEKDVFWVKGV